MDERLFYTRLDQAINRGSIPDILDIWKETMSLGSVGIVARHLITESVPDLVLYYQLDLEGDVSFQKLVAAYKEKERKEETARISEYESDKRFWQIWKEEEKMYKSPLESGD